MRYWIFSFLILALIGCGKPTTSTEETAEGGDPPNKTFWQLKDDSELSVSIEPWPPQDGKADITAHASLGDWGGDLPITESMEYRVSKSQDSSDPWTSMTRSDKKVDSDGDSWTEYEFKATGAALPSGKVYVQFRIKGKDMDEKLNDWAVTVP